MAFTRSLSRARCLGLAGAAALVAAACATDPASPPASPAAHAPAFGKTVSGPAVSSAAPKSGDQGQTLDVHVYGSGFTAGAQAQWALHGVPDATKVRTNGTTVVSATELVASITIAPDASIAYWDVQVYASGKTGVGTEAFEVTTAMPVASGTANGVNVNGQIVGAVSLSPTTSHAFLLDLSGPALDLGADNARSIDEAGTTIIGGLGNPLGNPFAAVWARPAGGSWPVSGTRLPDPVGSTSAAGLARAIVRLDAEGLTLITGTALINNVRTALVWQSADAMWTTPPTVLAPPPQYATTTRTEGYAFDARADVAGQVLDATGYYQPIFWQRTNGAYVATRLPLPAGYTNGGVLGMSPDGSILVGQARVNTKLNATITPVFWRRNADATFTARTLPTLAGPGAEGAAYAVTVVGTQVRAVGSTLSSSGNNFTHATYWTWDVASNGPSGVKDLGGVGAKSDVHAYAINASGTTAVGGDGTSAIRWNLP